jgi:serine/threonine protein kinase
LLLDNKYSIIKELGSGGFGKVYLAKEVLSKRHVAIKKLHTKSKKDQSSIIREIEIVAKFQHPNIVQYFHHFRYEDELYLVMEYCSGGNLREKIGLRNYKETEIFDWLETLCQTFRVIHTNGVYHRDIKPDNILFTGDGTIKVSDFGIANQNKGTICYMSPESLKSKTSNSRLIDIYALGVTLMELLIYKNPFVGKPAKIISEMHLNASYPINHLPIWQQQIIKKAIEPNENNRFQFMVEMEEAIRAQSIPIEFDNDFFRVSKLITLAEKELKSKKWHKAKSILETAKQIEPNNLLLLQAFAKFFLKTGDIESSKKNILKALKLNPRIQFQKELGWINLEESNYSSVISLLSDHLRREKNDLECFNLLIRTYYETGRLSESIKLSKLLYEQHPELPCFLNNYLISYYAINNVMPNEISFKSIEKKHPIIEYNLGVINDKQITYRNIASKLLFLNFNHNSIQQNRLCISSKENNKKLDLTFEAPIIKIGRFGFNCNDLELENSQSISRRQGVIINSKNDVWIYDLNGVNGVKINGNKIAKKAFLIGVNKLTINDSELWINADGDKLL